MPLISIVIPTFNRSSVILRAINSILNQTFKDFEIIIIDDGSTDETYELLVPLINEKKINYFKFENKGVSKARNLGVAHSESKYVTFLDSDDEWLPHKLLDQVNFLKADNKLRIVFGEEIWIRNGIRVNQKKIHQKSGGWIFKECVQQCFIAPSSVLLERSLFLEMNGFDEEFLVCEDYDLWLRISVFYQIGFIAHPIITKHGGHDDQLSTKFVAMDFWRIKSMNQLLKSNKLNQEQVEVVSESMKRRGNILLQGYQKHGNTKDFELVNAILKNLN